MHSSWISCSHNLLWIWKNVLAMDISVLAWHFMGSFSHHTICQLCKIIRLARLEARLG